MQIVTAAARFLLGRFPLAFPPSGVQLLTVRRDPLAMGHGAARPAPRVVAVEQLRVGAEIREGKGLPAPGAAFHDPILAWSPRGRPVFHAMLRRSLLSM